MKTLAEFPVTTSEWFGYTLESRPVVISWGSLHFGRVQTVIARDDAELERAHADNPRYRKMAIGTEFSYAPVCNGNGQRKGRGPARGLDTDRVTCKKCLAYLEATSHSVLASGVVASLS